MSELAVIVVLLAVNGIFAMAEIALVSARRVRLEQRANEGDAGAALALSLVKDPERFLSTVQVGITLVGVLAGAFGGATLAQRLQPYLERVPVLAGNAEVLSFAFVVGVITYLSLIVGELVPKNLALRNPESIACRMARPMHLLSVLAFPLVWFLGVSTRLVLGLFGKTAATAGPTPDEVRVLLREGLVTGGVRPEENELVEGVFDLREVLAEEIMRPKPKVLFLAAEALPEQYWPQVAASRQSVFPVYEGFRDEIAGLVSLRDLYAMVSSGKAQPLRSVMRPPEFVAENQPALSLFDTLRRSGLGAALVTDEFGTIRGLVTLEDLLEEVVGDLRPRLAPTADEPVLREAGQQYWLADGDLEIDHVLESLPDLAPAVLAEKEPFQTLAGFIVHSLDRLPSEGDAFSVGGFDFEIIDMDRQRIDKVAIRRQPAVLEPSAAEVS
ncbi:MAG: hemolysin family protein [Thermoanaerobaculia bacterium]|nr:hemolysin family protein [Thermoanaerobaculia bacterium]